MSKVRVVVFVQDGLVVDVITDSSKEIEYLVVDSDPQALDKSVMKLMGGPFDDISCLVSTYGDDAYRNPERVKEVYDVRAERFGGRNHHVLNEA